MKLTLDRLTALECPSGKKDVLVFDTEQRGLGVRVTNGARGLEGKSYIAQYRHNGAVRRMHVAPCNAVSLKQARELVRSILGDVAKGGDPAHARKAAAHEAMRQAAAREVLTLDELIERWRSLHLAGKRPRYAAEAVRALHYAFEKHLHRPAGDLDKRTVAQIVDSIAAAGKLSTARATTRYGSAAYAFAIRRDWLSVNPFTGLIKKTPTQRDRVLKDDELRAVWNATEVPSAFNSIVRMLMLTGQRRDEVAGMAWDEFSADLSTWTIPGGPHGRTKNGLTHIVPLSPQAQAVLRAVPRSNGTDLLFPRSDGKPFCGFAHGKLMLDKENDVKDWRLHDLRRTLATGLQKLGVRLEVTEAVLNHVSGSRAGIVGIYQRHDWAEEKRAALNAWGAKVEAIVEGRGLDGAAVLQFRAAR